jgi:hypothetical protein
VKNNKPRRKLGKTGKVYGRANESRAHIAMSIGADLEHPPQLNRSRSEPLLALAA